MFHKGHVPHNILECTVPILKAPPNDIFDIQTTVTARRQAWILCQGTSLTNQMLHAYKKKFCPPEKANLERKVRLLEMKDCERTGEPGCCDVEDPSN